MERRPGQIQQRMAKDRTRLRYNGCFNVQWKLWADLTMTLMDRAVGQVSVKPGWESLLSVGGTEIYMYRDQFQTECSCYAYRTFEQISLSTWEFLCHCFLRTIHTNSTYRHFVHLQNITITQIVLHRSCRGLVVMSCDSHSRDRGF